jgi:hypothetical protein
MTLKTTAWQITWAAADAIWLRVPRNPRVHLLLPHPDHCIAAINAQRHPGNMERVRMAHLSSYQV